MCVLQLFVRQVETNLIFLIKPFLGMMENSRQKFKYANEKSI